MSANITLPGDFESNGTMLHAQALFNPISDQRESALKQLRAQSVFSPDEWEQLDAATGVNASAKELVADASLQIDEWMQYSGEVRSDFDRAPSTVDRLLGAGYGTSASLSRYVYVSQMRTGEIDADVSMNGRARGRQDMPAYGLDGVPLPIVHADYEIDNREYQNAQAFGEDFDSSVGEEAEDAVEDGEADLLWNGWGGTVQTDRGPFSIDGLDEDSGKNLSGSSSGWGTPSNILSDVTTMQDKIENQGDKDDDVPMVSENGAFVFVPTEQWGLLTRSDYETSATDEPVIDRLNRKYPYITFVPAPRLTDGNVIMLVRDKRYFDIVTAQSSTNMSWDVDGGMGLRNKLLASRIPYVKEQPNGIYGIVRFTGA